MDKTEVLHSKLLKARITELEYKDLTIENIRRIYVEETGEEPPGKITLYHSDELPKSVKEYDSGFDGTVIHFMDLEKGLNESYTITRGSEMGEDNGKGLHSDWFYNLFGIFGGKVQNQYQDARYFEKYVNKEISNVIEIEVDYLKKQGIDINTQLTKYGIGHSLGGNLIQMLQITDEPFESVLAINDAPPSMYQLAMLDIDFQESIYLEYNINSKNFNDIYKIDPEKLKEFAEEYYQAQGQSIHHLTIKEEILYSVIGFRGFLDLGSREVLTTYPHTNGIAKYMNRVSDENLYSIQQFVAKHAPAYEKSGIDGLNRSMFGIDQELFTLIDDIKQDWKKIFEPPKWKRGAVPMTIGVIGFGSFTVDMPFAYPVKEFPSDFFSNQQEFISRALEIKAKLEDLTEVLPSLLALVGEISEDLLKLFQVHVEEMLGSIQRMIEAIGSAALDIGKNLVKGSFTHNLSQHENILTLIELSQTIELESSNIQNSYQAIINDTNDFVGEFGDAAHAHGMEHVVNSLNQEEGRRYEGSDLIRYKNATDGRTIEVNLSSAVRIYQLGLDKCMEKEEALTAWRRLYYTEYVDDLEFRKQRVMNAIHQMEANPRNYSHLLPVSSSNVKVTKINVHEFIRPLDPMFQDSFEGMYHYLREEIEKNKAMISRVRNSIEELFEEDQSISKLFELR
ncbi:hypothetical protein K7887_08190 [Sutcliffiella horikoshii]|uniref:DUF6792 domain-containing protein n=1 Tax=Sutcliffiella horikoshii TaxID=79883 RepID=UPI001CC1618F|nr:DUF6792 domain-containing protein [Sutcliffiella horikoshii]UAL48896.1 hypothetical protein K7887_08190 [Sutcliffiella horikoshii]